MVKRLPEDLEKKLENFTTGSCPTYDKLNYEINDNGTEITIYTDNGIPNAELGLYVINKVELMLDATFLRIISIKNLEGFVYKFNNP